MNFGSGDSKRVSPQISRHCGLEANILPGASLNTAQKNGVYLKTVIADKKDFSLGSIGPDGTALNQNDNNLLASAGNSYNFFKNKVIIMAIILVLIISFGGWFTNKYI